MTTTRDLINSTMRKIGVLASGETPTAAESSDALTTLQRMLSSWATEGLMVPKVTREELTIVTGIGNPQIGETTGVFIPDYETQRPVRILRASVIVSGQEMPIKVATAEEWSQISNKSMTGEFPTVIYPEAGSPFMYLNCWPVPSSANTLVLESIKPITGTLTLSTTLYLPDGYEEAIEYNLGLRLAPEYKRPIDVLFLDMARNLKANLMRQNARVSPVKSDIFGLVGRKPYNILTGE